jgi:hypothetical protein
MINPLLEAPNLSVAGSACEAFPGHLDDDDLAFLRERAEPVCELLPNP